MRSTVEKKYVPTNCAAEGARILSYLFTDKTFGHFVKLSIFISLFTVIMLDNEMLVERYPDQAHCSPCEVSSSMVMPSIPKGGVLVRVSITLG